MKRKNQPTSFHATKTEQRRQRKWSSWVKLSNNGKPFPISAHYMPRKRTGAAAEYFICPRNRWRIVSKGVDQTTFYRLDWPDTLSF